MPRPTSPSAGASAAPARIAAEIRARHRFLVTSHARPDGDSIGSQLAMAFTLDALGKSVRIINRDPVPAPFAALPGAGRIEVAEAASGAYDALIVLECSDLDRPGIRGLGEYFILNIDHHLGNTSYGAVNWIDESAAACGEMVFEVVERLGVRLGREIATHVYVAVLTDTGSFRHSNITARTFEICRRVTEAGVVPAGIAGQVYDSSRVGKLRLIGEVLAGMTLAAGGRLAILHLDSAMLAATGCTQADTEGIINLPLTAREVEAVVMFKSFEPGETRVSLRSKAGVDVRQVALGYGGGGHRNAAGFSARGPIDQVRDTIVGRVREALDAAPVGEAPST
jgi:phosphoesterase RecJ-like protein